MSVEAERLLRKIFGDESPDSEASRPRRPINTEPLFLLREIWPDVVAQLKVLLTDARQPELAATVETLKVFDRCRCGADFCATVYTKPEPSGGYGPAHRNIAFFTADTVCIDEAGQRIPKTCDYPTAPHTTILDVVNGQIMCIEIHDDHASRRRLVAALPDDERSDINSVAISG
jgi:hypothetical protein